MNDSINYNITKKQIITIIIVIAIFALVRFIRSDFFQYIILQMKKSPKNSVSDSEGVLLIFGPKRINSRKKILRLKFENQDYSKLSSYALHEWSEGSINEMYPTNLNYLTFIRVEGYREENRKPVLFIIAYNELKNAVVLPTDSFEVFCQSYNKLIKDQHSIVECISLDSVKNYFYFIREILSDTLAFEKLIKYNFNYNKHKKTIDIGKRFYVDNISAERYRTIKEKMFEENFSLQENKAEIKFCAFNLLKALKGEFILYNLTFEIYKNGKIDIKTELLLKNKCRILDSGSE